MPKKFKIATRSGEMEVVGRLVSYKFAPGVRFFIHESPFPKETGFFCLTEYETGRLVASSDMKFDLRNRLIFGISALGGIEQLKARLEKLPKINL